MKSCIASRQPSFAWRYVIMLLFLAAAVYSGLSVGRVKLSSDLTAFLPADTETRRGLTIMEEEFTTCASENIMVANVTFDTGRALADRIGELEHVASVGYDDTSAHYAEASALLSVFVPGRTATRA